jgi:hypothetical protein
MRDDDVTIIERHFSSSCGCDVSRNDVYIVYVFLLKINALLGSWSCVDLKRPLPFSTGGIELQVEGEDPKPRRNILILLSTPFY